MTTLPAAVERYLTRNAVAGPWQFAGDQAAGVVGAVVIPSLAEGENLFRTLQSLAANPPEWTARFLIVVVINQGALAADGQRRQNRLDLTRLADLASNQNLRLAWIDAASPGQEVPARRAGVGFARKLGLDLVLSRLDWREDPVLVCLDADTLVETGYLQAVAGHFRRSRQGAAVLPFRHQPAAGPSRQAAIDRYELFLRSYVLGLFLAGSPYAFHAVGSAMACRASAYVRCGGMNCRQAGEDFYFLQKLAKTDGISRLSGTTVFPEPRPSMRVPFGTGRSMIRLLGGDSQAVLFYPAVAFRVLEAWLQTVGEYLAAPAEVIWQQAEKISPVLADYLTRSGWDSTWSRLQTTHQTGPRLLKAFHGWFDGFKSLRLIHLLCEAGLQRGEPLEILPEYFEWGGISCPGTVAGMLEAIRLWEESALG